MRERYEPRVYVASKITYATMFKEVQKNHLDIHFTMRWHFYAGQMADSPEYARHFWQHDIADILRSDFLVLYGEPEDRLRGALVEAGVALASGIPVIVVGEHTDYGTWQYHPAVVRVINLNQALSYIKGESYKWPA